MYDVQHTLSAYHNSAACAGAMYLSVCCWHSACSAKSQEAIPKAQGSEDAASQGVVRQADSLQATLCTQCLAAEQIGIRLRGIAPAPQEQASY